MDGNLSNIRELQKQSAMENIKKKREKTQKLFEAKILKYVKEPMKVLYRGNAVLVSSSENRPENKEHGLNILGAGAYGKVYAGYIDKDRNFPIAVKMGERLKFEYKMMQLLKSFSVPDPYAWTQDGSGELMYYEYVNSGDCLHFVKSMPRIKPIIFKTIVTQALFNLYKIHQKFPTFRHHDLHMGNLLINTLYGTKGKTKIVVGSTVLYVDNIGIEIIIHDFGLSTVSQLPNTIIARGYEHAGIGYKSCYKYDFHYMLNSMYYEFKKIPAFQETKRFIEDIIPPSFLQAHSRFVSDYRLKLGVSDALLPTFTDIFKNKYFNIYRKSKMTGALSMIPAPKVKVVSINNYFKNLKYPNVITTKEKELTTQKKMENKAKALAFMRKKKETVKARAPKVFQNLFNAKDLSDKTQMKLIEKAQAFMRKQMPVNNFMINSQGNLKYRTRKVKYLKKPEVVSLTKKAGASNLKMTIPQMVEWLKIKYINKV